MSENSVTFERDLAVRQLKVQEANLKVIRQALNENRPLEALQTANNALDALNDELESFEEAEAIRERADGSEEGDAE